jgi:hypothetical protein
VGVSWPRAQLEHLVRSFDLGALRAGGNSVVDDEGYLSDRRLRMKLTMRADSLGDACEALRRIADELQDEGPEDVHQVTGRLHTGHGISLEVTDPAMTGSRYRAALKLWKTKSGCGPPRPIARARGTVGCGMRTGRCGHSWMFTAFFAHLVIGSLQPSVSSGAFAVVAARVAMPARSHDRASSAGSARGQQAASRSGATAMVATRPRRVAALTLAT